MIAELQTGLNGDPFRSLPIEALPTSANGWAFRPFQIVSLLDVIRHSLTGLNNLALVWHSLPHVVEKAEDQTTVEDGLVLTEAHKEKVREKLVYVNASLEQLGLKQSLKYINTIRDDKLSAGDFTFAMLRHEADILQQRIDHELDDIVTGFIPIDRVPYLENEELFGPEVNARFPSATADIVAAGTCYAHGLHTASVFHLMRAVELSTRRMLRGMKAGKHLTRPIELCTWGELIAALEEGLKGLTVGKRTSTVKASTFEFYSHAVGVFRNFKGAWRDPVSHTGKQYKPGETKDIMDNTRQFMQHLATRLSE